MFNSVYHWIVERELQSRADGDLAELLLLARREATRLHHETVTIDHLLVASCSVPLVREAITLEDGDPDRWMTALREDLVATLPSTSDRAGSRWCPILRAMLYDRTGGVVCVRRESIAFVASFAFGPQHRELDGFRLGERARAIGAPSLEAGPYRKATPRRKHADLVLIDAGVCRADVFAHIVHGRPCSEVVIDPRVLDGGEARAVLLNDDWSTVEFVVDQLESVYGFSAEDAAQIASEVDREGRAWVSRGPVDALVPDAQALIDAAREKGFPLRIDIEPE